jgi:hypothetical protein
MFAVTPSHCQKAGKENDNLQRSGAPNLSRHKQNANNHRG